MNLRQDISLPRVRMRAFPELFQLLILQKLKLADQLFRPIFQFILIQNLSAA